jgi:4-amino-4-deoxy-L-arabinose transferase-like glycosyltransferase
VTPRDEDAGGICDTPSRRLLLGASLGFSALTAALVALGDAGTLTFLAWLASLAAGLALLHRPGRRNRLAGRDWLALALLVALAGFFRLYRIGEIPSGPWVDELAAAANAVNLAARQPFTPFGTTPLFEAGPNWVHTPNLYLYFCYAVLWLSGFSQLGMKLISALPGIATPPLLYLLGRRFLSREAALLAAGLLAVSNWQVTVGRWGWDEVLVTALTVAAFAVLLAGVQDERPASFFLAGVVIGLAQYAYVAARLSALAAVAFLAVRAFQTRRRRRLLEFGLFGVGLLQAVLPIAVFYVRHPATFAVREREISILPRLFSGDLAPLLENLRAYGLMFLVRGDANPRQNLPGLPMLDLVAGFLFVAGLVAAVAAWRRAESQLTMLWLSLGLLGGILSHPESAPNSYRVGVVAPACMLLAGMGWQGLVAVLRRVRPGALARSSAYAAAATVALSGALTFANYFVARPASRECWLAVKEGAYCEVLRRRAERVLDAGAEVLLDRRLRWVTTRLQFDTLLARRRPAASLCWVEPGSVEPAALHRGVLFVGPERYTELPGALQALPARAVANPFGEEVFVAISADRHLLALIEPGSR